MITLDIGSKYCKIIYAATTKKSIKIKKSLMVKTPENAVENGFITDVTAVADVISQAISSTRIKDTQAIVCVESSQIVAKELQFPKVDIKKLDKMIAMAMDTYLKTEEYSVQYTYHIVKDMVHTQIYAIPETIIEKYKQLLTQIGLVPVAMDVNSNAIEKLIKVIKIMPDKAHMIVADIGYDEIKMHIFSEGTFEYTRCAKINIDYMNKLHIQELFLQGEEPNEDDVNYSIFVSAICDELQKMIQFYSAKGVPNDALSICLCGGTSLLCGLPQTIESDLNVHVVRIEEMNHVELNGTNPAQYINAIGAQVRL
ncbi:MAG: pilus assembly protein PilM [Christensenellaceae bacterium]